MRRLLARIGRIPHLFAKSVVLWCLVTGTAASAFALLAQALTGVDLKGTLGVVLGFLGGELLGLCARSVIKGKSKKVSDPDTKRKDDTDGDY